jgi:putative protease
MCVSVSGRCFLSQYSFGESANKGECLQPCRREYLIKDKDEGYEYVLGEDYIMSPKDLCTIDFIDELIKAGIDSFKIEARARSAEYVKVATACYREAIDAFFRKELDDDLKNRLKKRLTTVYNRGFSSGFYFGKPQGQVSRQLQHTHQKVFLGEVKRFYKKISVADVLIQAGTLKKGDTLMFIGKSTPALSAVATELQSAHEFVDSATKGQNIGVKLPFVVKPKDKVFLWEEK